MRFKIAAGALLLTFAGVACDTAGDVDNEPEASADVELDEGEFRLTGTVIDAQEGAKPEGAEEDTDADADVNAGATAETDGEGDDEILGGIAVRPDDANAVENVDDCETTKDAYIAYYTADTEGDLPEGDEMPEALVGGRFTVEGEKQDGEDCVLIATELETAPPLDTTDDGTTEGDGTGTGTGDGTAGSPGPQESPTVTSVPNDDVFPQHSDTDPIFEGTPDPDDCEGQKACNNEPGIGQPDDGGGN